MSQNLALNLFIIENAILIYFLYRNRETVKAYLKKKWDEFRAD